MNNIKTMLLYQEQSFRVIANITHTGKVYTSNIYQQGDEGRIKIKLRR